jgi:TetR/AcrR family transcriptional regulator, regulator of cefoperazone and chloramphenicol sensitivity
MVHEIEITDATRLRLLEAAEEVFAEKGFEAAGTREICVRAGVKNVGAINYYFQGKERLYAEAVKFAMRTCVQGVPFPDWPKGVTAEKKLRDFIRVMMARIMEIPKVASMNLMMREITRLMPSIASSEAIRENIKPMADLLKDILEEMLPDVPHDRRILIGFSVIGQCLYYRQNRIVGEVLFGKKVTRNFDVDYLSEHIADFTLAAVGKALPVGRSKGGKS